MNISGTIPRLEFEVIMIFINMLLLTRGQFFVYLHEYERALYADVHLQYQALMYKHCAGANLRWHICTRLFCMQRKIQICHI